MSFASDIRDELGLLPIKPLCCRRAYLYGLIYGAEVEGDRITAVFPVVKEAAYHPHEQAVSLIHTLFSREATVTHESRGAHRYAHLSFEYKAAAKNLRAIATTVPTQSPARSTRIPFNASVGSLSPHKALGTR